MAAVQRMSFIIHRVQRKLQLNGLMTFQINYKVLIDKMDEYFDVCLSSE